MSTSSTSTSKNAGVCEEICVFKSSIRAPRNCAAAVSTSSDGVASTTSLGSRTGDRAALALADAAAAVQASYAAVQHVAGELGALLVLAGRRTDPGSVTHLPGAADALARAAGNLALVPLAGPRLRTDLTSGQSAPKSEPAPAA